MGTAPFFGQAPAGVYFGAVPPGMDLAMMGMPPPFMGMMGQEFVADDYEEPLGGRGGGGGYYTILYFTLLYYTILYYLDIQWETYIYI